MSEAQAGEFLHVLAAAAQRDGDADELAARAAGALRQALAGRRSLVLDVQFTGFMEKGRLVGGVDPQLLRAAGQLIMLRVSRIGFTADAGEGDLAALFRAVGQGPGKGAEEGIVAALREHQPRGIYLSTSTGGIYRPPAPRESAAGPAESAEPAPAADAPAAAVGPERPPATPSGAGAGWDVGEDEEHELSAFEVIDAAPELEPPPPAAAGSAPGAPAGGAAQAAGSAPPGSDMYDFFRTAVGQRSEVDPRTLPGLLHGADSISRFDELAQAAAREAVRLIRSDDPRHAVELLDALVSEAERADRTRVFRDSAVQALRRAGTEQTLQQLGELLRIEGPDRERILHFLLFLGGEAIQLMEGVLFRAGDPRLRSDIFRALLRREGAASRVMARALEDPSPGRARVILELATLPEVDPDLALRWINEAASHPEPTVRMDAARYAAGLGTRGGLRVLVDLLSDRDRLVQRAAVEGLGAVGDPATVPFLARLLGEGGDEDIQVAAVAALGQTGSAEALPALMGVVNRRTLFGSRRMARLRSAAVAALGRIPSPAAREALASLAAGKDSDLSAEARRALQARGSRE